MQHLHGAEDTATVMEDGAADPPQVTKEADVMGHLKVRRPPEEMLATSGKV